MRNDSTVFVALDVHQKSIVGAYAVDAGEVSDLGQVGILQRDLDRSRSLRLCGLPLSHR